ncbi:hypothetical protein EVAR_41189_1 [Eumeta japonica]|uniref:Uncharacterized protein n=1 Tax=Eumeta variegata TaxID=151549 RepID=A0A4C1WS22_EUMVA|nr:hypothetical protein EVAR_41189_1 [Eumeta japonica]
MQLSTRVEDYAPYCVKVKSVSGAIPLCRLHEHVTRNLGMGNKHESALRVRARLTGAAADGAGPCPGRGYGLPKVFPFSTAELNLKLPPLAMCGLDDANDL